VIRLDLPWPPATGNHQYRKDELGRPRLISKVHEYRRTVWLRWLQAGRPYFPGPVELRWYVTQPTASKRDFDGLSKVVMDALVPPKPTRRVDRARMLPDDSMQTIRRQTVEWCGVSRGRHGVVVEVVPLEVQNGQ